MYGDGERFRSTIIMARHGFGRGEYKYFADPLPELVGALRRGLYRKLAPVAERWSAAMGLDAHYPPEHDAFRARCRGAGQTRPTPLLLRYGPGDYNCLHQDVYGPIVFPTACRWTAPPARRMHAMSRAAAADDAAVAERRDRARVRHARPAAAAIVLVSTPIVPEFDALELRPDYAEAYSNLANLLLDQGAYDHAEAMARRAIKLKSDLADAYINLAAVATARHRYADALHVLDALLAFAPSHARALSARALTLKELDRLDEALEAAKRAALAAPESPEPHNAMGQVLQWMGRFEPALAAYDRAVELTGPAQMDAIANRAALFMEFGRKEEAIKALELAAKAFPNSPGILFGQTDIRPLRAMRSADRPDASAARPRGDFARRPGDAPLRARQGFLDIGNSAEAFRHYDEANQLKRSTLAYDAGASERRMASIAEAFSPAMLATKADTGARSDLPVFVLGMPRSGTTLIEQILASHRMVHGAGELKRLHTLIEAIGDFPAFVPGLTGAQLNELGEAYLAAVAPLAPRARRVVDKMPSNFMLCAMIRIILPDARIIHCRRDPVDTCLSCYTKLFADEQAFTYNQMELGRFHRAYHALMAHWRSVLPASHFLEVDYEAVVDDLEREARRMLDFLGLPWDEAVLKFHENDRPVRAASVNQVRQPTAILKEGRDDFFAGGFPNQRKHDSRWGWRSWRRFCLA